jgi:hypothetical protein
MKERYRDIMYNFKKQSAKRAWKAGRDIEQNDISKFSIIRDYPPDLFPDDVWRQMCDVSELIY